MMSRIEAHPDAAIFPMMSVDELAELAADIKENGQRFPIVIGPYEGREVIIDGRNRYEACEIAGVEPKFEKLNGHDPKTFILSVNVNRRHLSSGQRAMAAALIHPDPARMKRKAGSVAATLLVDGTTSLAAAKTSLSHARTVLRDSRVLAMEVMSGAKFLDTAYNEAKARSDASQSAETMLANLRARAPDLADLVTEDRMTLMEATAVARERVDSISRQRKLTADEMSRSIHFFVYDNVDAATRAEQLIELLDLTDGVPKMKQMVETLKLLIAEAEKGQAHARQ